MKNIEASVGVIPTQGKEEEVKVEVEEVEEEYTEHENEIYFFPSPSTFSTSASFFSVVRTALTLAPMFFILFVFILFLSYLLY